MKKAFLSLLKKDFKMMLSGKFFLLAAGSLILYTCYIHFVYVKAEQPSFPVYLYEPEESKQEEPDASVIRAESREELMEKCEDGYSVGLDMSGKTTEVYMVSCGTESLDNCRMSYAISLQNKIQSAGAQIIGTNNKEMKNRREMTAECLFFELTAVGFLGLAAMLFKEKQMGVIRVHSILPLNRSTFICSKILLILASDFVFAVLLTLLNLGVSAGLDVLPGVLLHSGILSLIMAMLGFLCALMLPDFKQFSLFYLVLAVFITTPVFLAVQTGLSPGWIHFHPMYHLFMALKQVYFQETQTGILYYACCLAAILLLFLAARRMLEREMTKEG